MIDFDKLSPAAARVAIVRDVIARLDAQKIVASHGSYVSHASYLRSDCQTCALGAMFVCSVAPEVWQSMTNRSTNTQGPLVRAELSKHFDKLQLQMIECAHERDFTFYSFLDHEEDYPAEISRAVRFGDRFGWDEDEKRLRAICQNIIENDGEFVP